MANVSASPLRMTCAVTAILLSATSCFEPRSAEHWPLPRTGPEPPAAEVSVASYAPAPRPGPSSRPGALLREPGAEALEPRGAFLVPGASMARADTWDRLRLLMTLAPVGPDVSSLREFRRKLHRYHGNQRFFDHIGDRARPWLYHITRELAERGMPGEIALLPAVESGYDARAVSSRNAAGVWQILPGTARDLDLSRSRWYDARYDVPAATAAALDYLTTLRTLFNDDWLLAVAAYNCGPGNVRRAIRRAGLEIGTADYPAIERHLPRETRSHVARWLVLSEIAAMPRLHNVRLEEVPWRPYFTAVSGSSRIDLRDAARRAGMSAAELSALNLAHRHGMTAPSGPHRVLVPVEHADRVRRALSRVLRPAPLVAEGGRYRIRPGDTLGLIARAHDTTVQDLMAANGLDSHLIRAGRELLIPGAAGSPSGPLPSAVHVVRPGDTLWVIARQYRTSVGALRDWNRLAPGSDLLRPGQHLRVRSEG